MYVHNKSKYIFKYMISTDIEKDRDKFELRKQKAEEDRRFCDLRNITFEVEDITGNLDERFAYYILPQMDRIHYGQSVLEATADRKKLLRTLRAIDWVIEHFQKWSIHMTFQLMK